MSDNTPALQPVASLSGQRDSTSSGPAFPSQELLNDGYGNIWSNTVEGMTLRDYFAARAMASLCMVNQGNMPEPACQQAYVWADAMLKAR